MRHGTRAFWRQACVTAAGSTGTLLDMSSQAPLDSLKRSRRDQEAFSGFYRYYFRQILGFLARRVQDPEVAADLTAETFAQAFLHRRRFRGTSMGEVDRWIYRIAEHQLSHYWRDGKTERGAMERLRIQAPALDSARRDAIEQLAETEGLRSALRAGLAQISSVQREAVALRLLEDLSYTEIAERLAITEIAARARVSRALRALANSMQQNITVEETP